MGRPTEGSPTVFLTDAGQPSKKAQRDEVVLGGKQDKGILKTFSDWLLGGDNSPTAGESDYPDLLPKDFNEAQKFQQMRGTTAEIWNLIGYLHDSEDDKKFNEDLKTILEKTPMKDISPDKKEGFLKVMKAARRSPLMALGLLGADPKRIFMDSGKEVTALGGETMHKGDLVYFKDALGSGSDVLMHELTHRSLNFLQNDLSPEDRRKLNESVSYRSDVINPELKKKLGDRTVDVEELLVRHIVDKYGMVDGTDAVPDDENMAKAQHQMAQYLMDNSYWFPELVDRVEKAAKIRIIQNEKR